MKKSRKQIIALLIFLTSIRCAYSQQTDSIATSNFNTTNSLGIGIFGHDLISSTYRFPISDKCLIMAGIGLKMLLFDGSMASKISYTVSTGGIIYLSKRKSKIMNLQSTKGIYCIGGYSFGGKLEPFGSLSQSYLSIGYHYELFVDHNTNSSFSFLIGPSISHLQSKANFKYDFFYKRTNVLPGIFLRLQYNFLFRNKQ